MPLNFRLERIDIDKIEWPEIRIPSNLEAQEKLILKQSIKELGLLHPIIVCKDKEGRYVGVAGYNRYLAARADGIEKIEARVYEPCDESLNLMIMLAENAGRGKVSDYDMLKAIAKLNQGYKIPVSKISEITGLSVSTISKLIRVYQKSLPLVHELMQAGKLTVWHALELLRLPDARSQYEYATMAAEYGWSVRELRETITRYLDQLRIEEECATMKDTASVYPGTTTPKDLHEMQTEDLTQTTTASAANEMGATEQHDEAPTTSPEAPQPQMGILQEAQGEQETLQAQNLPTCAICGKPITHTPITVQAHKQCLITAAIALKQLATILGKQPDKLTAQDAASLRELAELALKYIQEHPEEFKQ